MTNDVDPEKLEQAARESRQAVIDSYGIDPNMLDRWLAEEDKFPATDACLALSELTQLPFVYGSRREHVYNCDFCQEVIRLLC
jgi:hypothetical protein